MPASKKTPKKATDATSSEALEAPPREKYVLRLFVTGMTSRSTRAIKNLKRICEEYLKNRYELEVIDIYQQPEKAREGELIAAPTLIKQLPEPLRKLIGDMSDTERVLVGLNITPKAKKNTPKRGK